MDRFVSKPAEIAWNLFAKTGDINMYMLYSSIQHTPDYVLDKWAGDESVCQLTDQGRDNG